MPKEPKLTKVVFATERPGGEAPLVETVWAEKLGRSRYRLLNIPAFKVGISYEDIFEAKPSRAYSGRLCLTRVLEKSGNRTVRVLFDQPVETSEFTMSAIETLSDLGCQISGGSGVFFTLNLPPDCSLDDVLAFLESKDVGYHCADPFQEDAEESAPSS